MRTIIDLVAELHEEDADDAGIIVGFEDHTEYAWSHDPQLLATLKEVTARGGEPIGIATRKDGKVNMRPFVEYADEEWVEKYFITLMAMFRRKLEAAGFKTGKVEFIGSNESEEEP